MKDAKLYSYLGEKKNIEMKETLKTLAKEKTLKTFDVLAKNFGERKRLKTLTQVMNYGGDC